jgi:hypothetical protein
MNATVQSGDLFGQAEITEDMTKRALDELFSLTRQYRSAKAYHDLLRFIGRFRFYSPFNAMLVHVQMPGAIFVASPSRWLHDYGRLIRPGARPLVILQPMGPVMFVFDVSDTEPQDGAPQLPKEIVKPFEPRCGKVGKELEQTIENAKTRRSASSESSFGRSVAGTGLEPSGKLSGPHVRGVPGRGREAPGQVSAPAEPRVAVSGTPTPRPGGGNQQLGRNQRPPHVEPQRPDEIEPTGRAGEGSVYGDTQQQVAERGGDVEQSEAQPQRGAEDTSSGCDPSPTFNVALPAAASP